MAVKCDTPKCLRGVSVKGERCNPCNLGMPPMINPKSRHAWDNVNYSPKPKTVVLPGQQKPVIKTVTTKKPKKVAKVVKTQEEIKVLNKVAVQQIMGTFWYGWKDGCPELFNKMFMKFGNFVHFSVKPSAMVGTPDTQVSTINSSGHKAFAMYAMMMNTGSETKGSMLRKLQNESRPMLNEILYGISPQDTLSILLNNGQTKTFTKVGNGETYSYDDNGTTRIIPKWAIA